LKFWTRSSVLILALSSSLFAQTLTGTITNRTSGKPAAGDDVVLLALSNGMQEAARTKADREGRFSFALKDDGGPHLVRAIHEGVTYHKMAPPGTSSVEVDVYDAAKKVDGLNVTADVMRLQAEQGQLQVTRLFAVNNQSTPPRTQMNDANFEFFLPDGATVDQGMARAPNGQPINSAPVPQTTKNKYAFSFPLRPGETQFQVAFHLPYTGNASLDPKALYPTEHFVVEMPKSMQFMPTSENLFQSMQDPQFQDAIVHVAQRTTVSQNLSFKISGSAAFAPETAGGGDGSAAQQANDNRPGGGLGAPIDAPDPLEQYRWQILGGLTVLMSLGVFYVTRFRRASAVSAAPISMQAENLQAPIAPLAAQYIPARSPKVVAATPSGLLDALKEELFQLEIERKQGKITSEEYEKSRAALDHTLERALKRQN
jgi:hypothetical protein